jgi:hypothetical protein
MEMMEVELVKHPGSLKEIGGEVSGFYGGFMGLVDGREVMEGR